MKKLLVAGLAALTLLSFMLAGVVYADNGDGDKVIFGDNFTLGADETLNGDLVVLGGNVDIEEGATVAGNVVVLGGNVDIAGNVGEDVVVFGGNADLRDTAVVEGRLETVGGSISREEGATVKGGEGQGFNPGGFVEPRDSGPFGVFRPVIRFYGSVFSTFFVAVGAGLLALLVAAFWPEQTARVSAAVTTAPAASGGLGILTIIAVPILLALATITICLSPVAFVGVIVFVAAILFGWVALGTIVGARMTAALKLYNLSPASSAALGTFLFTLVTHFLGAIPCVGWIVPFLLAAIGLGAVTLTRFGTQPYFSNLPAPTTPPDAGPAVAA
ncbi:MAG: hypothetical protein ACRDH2_02925 [Anaerolineales bacterium]